MVRVLLTALVLLMPSLGGASPATVTESWNVSRPVHRNDTLMKDVVMKMHNDTRRAYGSAPLAWDDALAVSAMAYARHLAATRVFRHDPQDCMCQWQGENLFMGTHAAYSYEEMMKPLIDEVRDYRPGTFPDVSDTGDWTDVAHYTQIVWPATTHVGCAIASNERDDFLVCRYLPGGNVMGEAMR